MKSFARILLIGSLFIAFSALAHAQGGGVDCTDSPECPTAILGLVGIAGGALYSRLRSR